MVLDIIIVLTRSLDYTKRQIEVNDARIELYSQHVELQSLTHSLSDAFSVMLIKPLTKKYLIILNSQRHIIRSTIANYLEMYLNKNTFNDALQSVF